MNFLSLNIQWLWDGPKHTLIRDLFGKHHVCLLSLQETKKKRQVDVALMRSVWGNLDFDHAGSLSRGLSACILCI